MFIENLRNTLISKNNLQDTNSVYTFFYDETNNIRKLYLKENYFNAEPAPFVLGGIVAINKNFFSKNNELRTILNLQPSVKEIKLKHLAKGTFTDIIKSPKIEILLQWLLDNKLLIHFSVIDTLYWSIVDIIDSIVAPNRYLEILKSDLSYVVRTNIKQIIFLFNRYQYPAISKKLKNSFLKDLIQIIENSNLEHYHMMMLKGILQQGLNCTSLHFIEGNEKEPLIDDFSIFYFQSLILFKNSSHIFDEEKSIKDLFNTNKFFQSNLINRTYCFENSQNNFGIQLSDIIVGILGKMFSYICNESEHNILTLKNSLSRTEQRNLDLLKELILLSEKYNSAFIHHILSIHDKNKICILLSN